jgi:hypothetical protein
MSFIDVLQIVLNIHSGNMWSDARFPAAAPTLADFLNLMPSTEPQDDGVFEDIQESAEAALAASVIDCAL